MSESIGFERRFVPKQVKENILYERSEEDHGKVMISRKHPELQQLFYNKTALSILELCNGNTTVGEIAHNIAKKYKSVQYSEALDDTINTLHMLWRLGFIIWVGDNPFLSLYSQNVGEYSYSLLSEDQSIKWMENNRAKFFIPINIKDSNYSETAIRQNSFSFFESFFQLKKKNKEIVTISLLVPIGKECFFKIGILDYNVEGDDKTDIIIDFLKWACKKHKQFSSLSTNAESVLCYVRPSDTALVTFLKTYFKAVSVGVLQKELKDNSDVEIYQALTI